MRKALIVGIDYYESLSSLSGCVSDAHAVESVLARHGDGSVNFGVKLVVGSGSGSSVGKAELRAHIESLFADEPDIALFYFAGHGMIESTGGYLLTSDWQDEGDGIPLDSILKWANESKAKNKIIILDSCHSGSAGNPSTSEDATHLREGITILTASTKDQYAAEQNNKGVFTSLFVDALSGPAANLVGEVTPGSIYAHIDQSLGPWDQRPVFKTNVKNFVSLRTLTPKVPLDELRRIMEFFPAAGSEFRLDPSYEHRDEGRSSDMPPADPENNRRFKILQKLNRVNLVVPVDAEHMWNAAMEGKACRLTALGEHYRRLVERGMI